MKTTTFLTFVGDQCGKAQEAINFYISLFPNSEIKQIIKYDKDEAGGAPSLIKYGLFTLNNVEYMISESNFNHTWSFSPAVSIFITSKSEIEIESIFDKILSNNGQVMVPLDSYDTGDYGFGKMFGWCQDKFGVSWQFNLE
mgnify:FL=1